MVKNFMMVPIDQISPNKYQPRQDFEEEALQQLADSIKEFGVIQPITVRADEKYENFMIISGERRWRASQNAGLTEIPAYIRTPEDQEMAEMALVENLYREDLNPLEIAITYERLMNEFELTHQELAKRVEKGRATITNFIRLLKLSDFSKSKLRDGGISMGHAKAILGIGDKDGLQTQLCEEIIKEKLSVR
ncbi:MAG: ParB/RepB/Spo0J family partition protein, partial [Bacteroidota bacterium]